MQATGKSKSYHTQSLSIRLHADGFSFFVCDVQTAALVRGQHFELTGQHTLASRLTTELARPEYYNHQINQVFVVVESPATHVPLEGFRRDEAPALYRSVFAGAAADSRVAYTIMPRLEVVELYAIGAEAEEAILQFYPTARFFASEALILERLQLFEEKQEPDLRRLYCHLTAGHSSLFAFHEGRLHIANTFRTDTVADETFYILNLWQQLKLDALGDELLLLSNDATRLGQLCGELGLYLQHVVPTAYADLFDAAALAHEPQLPLDVLSLLLNRF